MFLHQLHQVTKTTHSSKSNGKAIAAVPVLQQKQDDAKTANIQIMSSISKEQTIQRKGIYDTVMYGHTDARRPYLATDKSDDGSMPHLTVDTLNAAIGLTNDGLQGGMVSKRKAIEDAIAPRPRTDLGQEEFEWTQWLYQRREALSLPSMDGTQCRADMKMDDSWLQRFYSIFNTPTQHNVEGRDGRRWKQESHQINVVDGIDDIKEGYGLQENRYTWNNQQRDEHNKYVLNPNGLNENIFNDQDVRDQIEDRTHYWLRSQGPVLYSFWRLTSKMGIDFFASIGKNIAFVRNPNQPSHIVGGRKSITDSEWEHANKEGNIQDGTVTRHDPIA